MHFFKNKIITMGFTLLELLTVISVITILVSILLPSLQKARSSAKTMQCANNLKTLFYAFENYAEDMKDYYTQTNSLGTGVEWHDLLYNNGCLSGIKPSMAQVNSRTAKTPILCSSATTIHSLCRTDFISNGGVLSGNADQNRYVKCKRSNIHRPSVAFSFMDGIDYQCLYPGVGPDLTKVGARHSNGMNLLFFDGHVKRWTWNTLPTGNWGYQNTMEPWCQTGE